MKKISAILVIVMIVNLFCLATVSFAATNVTDDAIALEANDNIAGYNNVTVQNWGSFADATFFGMENGDTTGNTYIIIKDPDGGVIENFSVVTYKHQDVAGSFSFAGASALSGGYVMLDVTESPAKSTAQGGFGERTYSCSEGLDGIKYIKVIFPSDSENWRAMIAEFTINESEGGAATFGGYADDALVLEDSDNVIGYNNLSVQTWGDFADDTFFGMQGGDTTGNTYLSIRVPSDATKVIVNAYKHQDISGAYTFETIPGGEALIPAEKSASAGQAGFGVKTYTFTEIPQGTTGIKITFPADSENWRLMIASFEAVTQAALPTGGYIDDALALDDNDNVTDYNNLSVQKWGDFTDDTFFGMQGGDTTGNTYLSIRVPSDTKKVAVTAYKHQDVSGTYTFEALPGGEPLIPTEKSAAAGQAGFAMYTYTFTELPEETAGIKITFPSDSENWRLMIASFEVTTEGSAPVGAGKYYDDALALDGNDNVASYDNLSVQNWGDFADNTFFGMVNGDTTSNTQLTITSPSAITKAVITTYKHQDITEDFAFETASGAAITPTSTSATAAGHSGFAMHTYTLSALPANTQSIKIVFPADSQNWRLMISSFEVEYGVDSSIENCIIKIGNASGSNILNASGAVTAAFSVNSQIATNDALIIIALYSGTKLETMSITPSVLKKGNNDFFITTGINKTAGVGDTIKVFVWDKKGNNITSPAVEK